ncbi:acyl-CoA dehydrogenase family protein [Marinicrinis lubricantis]|uniref:Acyl-CoA dehydrogenase family protein n=1 Tax=Marinicrinis lubricantis TaxID=2086470 RepID=A0ABW1IL79_9BACL
MNKAGIVGGEFLLTEDQLDRIVTPEDFTDEQHMFAETTKDFVQREVLPHDEQIEKLDYELTVKLMRKAGELGLLSADIPEAYGGLELDKVSSTLINESLSRASSFALSIGAHVGIGTLPIVFFGNEQQKQKYLPLLATGEKIAAYCLTEPASGSDALGAKTTAVLSSDGRHYVLNGSKLYITNAGFADIFIVYAKVDGKHFSAFIVERGMPGFSMGPEEKKMGIKGSSTRPLFFEDVEVPAENLLWEEGKGHLIAFNILNIGRFKLAAGCLGGAKEAIELSAKYANTRTQFGKPISSFPLIRQKLADMNVRTYVMESMVYRTSGYIDQMLRQLPGQDGISYAKGIAEYALECSINKVFATEALDFVADEGVQIHGGYGYIQEYKIERVYRDSRINRIFEGTNEINRLLIPGMLMKKAMKGELALLDKIQQLQEELLQWMPPYEMESGEEWIAYFVQSAKNLFLYCGGLAVQTLGTKLEEEQNILALLADMMIRVYAMESAWLRTKKQLEAHGKPKAVPYLEMTQVYAEEAFEEMHRLCKTAISALAKGDTLRTHLSILKKCTRYTPSNLLATKKSIADRVLSSERYIV